MTAMVGLEKLRSWEGIGIMQHFRRIRSGLSPEAFLTEFREFSEADVLWLRRAASRHDIDPDNNQEIQLTEHAAALPKVMKFVEAFAEEMRADLARVAICRIVEPTQPRADTGSYFLIRNRYSFVLAPSAGYVVVCHDEQVRFMPGELWWFDNKQYYSIYNQSDAPAVALIFDLLPRGSRFLAVNPACLPPPSASQNEKPEPRFSETDSNAASPAVDLLRKAIGEGCIVRGDQQRLISSTGASLGWLLDLRPLLVQPHTLKAAAQLFWEHCAELYPFQVCALELAGVPLLSAVLLQSIERGTPITGFIVRKERKTSGTGSLVDGTLSDLPIIALDDLLNSGRSLEKARVVLQQYRREMSHAFVLVDFRSAHGERWRHLQQISVIAAFQLQDLGLVLSAPASQQPRRSFRNIWSFKSPDPNFFYRVPKSFPVCDGDRVFFGSDCGTFWCLDAATGEQLWTFHVRARGHKNLWSSPALHNGAVYFGSYDGNVYCLDAVSGSERWRHNEADWVGSSPVVAPELNLLFIGMEYAVEGKRGSVVALTLDTGEKVWEYSTTRYTHASPAYWKDQQLLACGSNDNEMLLFEAKSGALRWRFQTCDSTTETASVRHAPAFDERRAQLITPCANGVIYVLDVVTGRELWSVKTDNTIYSVPLVSGDLAFVASTDKYLYVLDLEGQCIRTKFYAGAKLFCPPRLIRGRIYFGACSGTIFEMDPESLQITGQHQLPDALTNAIAYAREGEVLYALTYVNQLFAFTPENVPELTTETQLSFRLNKM